MFYRQLLLVLELTAEQSRPSRRNLRADVFCPTSLCASNVAGLGYRSAALRAEISRPAIFVHKRLSNTL